MLNSKNMMHNVMKNMMHNCQNYDAPKKRMMPAMMHNYDGFWHCDASFTCTC